MGTFSIWHLLVVLVIALVIFGAGKLRNIGSDLGGAIKNFRGAMKEEENKDAAAPAPAVTQEQGRTLEGESQRERDHTKT